MEKHALWTVSFQCLARSLTVPVLPKVNCNFILKWLFFFFNTVCSHYTSVCNSIIILSSLFDDPETRYKKLKRTASQFLISQYGEF